MTTRFAGSDSAMASLFGGMQSPEYDKLSKLGLQALSSTRQAGMKGDVMAQTADINAQAMVDAAEYGAAATEARGKAAGQSSLFSGIGSGISGIVGGIGSMGTSGGATPASYGASTFGGVGIGNNYGSAFRPGGSISNFGLGF